MFRFKDKSALAPILRPHLWRIWLLSGLAVLQSVLQVVMALIFRYVIDAVLKGSNRAALWSVLLILDLILLIGVHALASWLTSSTVDNMVVGLRSKLLDSAVNCADARLEGFHSGELLSRGMEDVRTLCDGLVDALPTLVGQVTQLVAAFGAMLLIYPSVAAVLVLVGIMVIAGVAAIRPVLKKRQKAVRAADEKVMSTMQEDLQQLELIQSLEIQDQILQRFDNRQKKSLLERFRQRCWSVGSNSAVNVASMMGTGVLVLWGTGKVAAGVLSYGSLTSLIQLLNQFRAPVLSLSSLWSRFAAIEVSAERLGLLLDIPGDKQAAQQQICPLAVVFENVTFRYTPDEDPVLENFNLRMPLDGWTSLTGFSGRGKSTLFKLILGLYTPQQGSVYLQTETGDIPCSKDTRHLFAYVPQDYALFSGTVLENLLLVAPDGKEADRRRALDLAKAEFVWDMNSAEETVLRENNSGLSKGQIQRLAIARAILMERPILLLDECTSALDAETESGVLRNLRALSKCAILVTHRPEALEDLGGITCVSMEK